MLVLTRRNNQKITIGDDITITIFNIGPDSVKVGIDAPKDLLVMRDEVERYIDEGQDDPQANTDGD